MHDQPFADDPAPHDDPSRFDLPADSAADERFLRRQRRRRLSEGAGEDYDPDPLGDLLDADEDRGNANTPAPAPDASPAALDASSALGEPSALNASAALGPSQSQDDEPTVDADAASALDEPTPGTTSADSVWASSPEAVAAADPFDPEDASAPESKNDLVDRNSIGSAGAMRVDDADDDPKFGSAGDTDDIGPGSKGSEDGVFAASAPPVAMPPIALPRIGALPAPRSLDGETSLPHIDRFAPDRPESAGFSPQYASRAQSPDGYELPAGLPAGASETGAGDSSFANFDWGANSSASPPIGPLLGGTSPGAEPAISLQPTLAAEDNILAAAIQKAGAIAEAAARPCMSQADAVAQQALDRAEAAMRKTEAVETQFHAYVDAMRQDLLLASAQWRAAIGRG